MTSKNIVFCFNYDVKKLVMIQKLEPRTAALKSAKIGHVEGVIVDFSLLSCSKLVFTWVP